jgi:hypothetical protein
MGYDFNRMYASRQSTVVERHTEARLIRAVDVREGEAHICTSAPVWDLAKELSIQKRLNFADTCGGNSPAPQVADTHMH